MRSVSTLLCRTVGYVGVEPCLQFLGEAAGGHFSHEGAQRLQVPFLRVCFLEEKVSRMGGSGVTAGESPGLNSDLSKSLCHCPQH